MPLTAEQKATMAAHLRKTNIAVEKQSPQYARSLELATRETAAAPFGEAEVPCYIFTAKNRAGRCPVHINLHGGGFVRPHAPRDEMYSARLADAIGGIVVDVDYSLAPEYPFPRAFDECYEVCRWVFAHAQNWGADEKRISLGGHSAGGNLTAAVALKSVRTGDFKLCLQVIDYGAMDLYTDPAEKPDSDNPLIPAERGRMFNLAYTDGDPQKARDPYCSPSAAEDWMLTGLPDALVITAGRDNLRFESEEYARRMALMGVNVTLRRFVNSDHGFVIRCDNEWEEAQRLIFETVKSK